MALLDHDDEHDPAGAPGAHTATGDGGTPAPGSPADQKKKQHRDNLVIIAVGIVGVIVTYLFYRSNKAAQAAATGTTSATSTLPSTSGEVVGSGAGGGGGYADQMAQQLAAQETANGQAISGLGTLLQTLSGEVADLQPGQGSTTTGSPASAGSVLPYIGPSSMPNIIQPGQYTSSQFEQVGTETNGVYSGEEVAGGVPLFGSAFGGLFQNFGLAGGPAPTYTGAVYAPTADQAYIGYTGAISGAPAPAAK
jgi:hypothetical protein